MRSPAVIAAAKIIGDATTSVENFSPSLRTTLQEGVYRKLRSIDRDTADEIADDLVWQAAEALIAAGWSPRT